MAEPVKDYTVMNKFQSDFYTSIDNFRQYSNYDIRTYGVQLLINMYKGFPHLADKVLNMYSPPFIVGMQSKSVLIALQRMHFINGFSRPRQPQFLFFKQSTKKAKMPDTVKAKKAKNVVDFEPEIVMDIKSILFMDSATYEYLKYSEKVQSVGRQLMGENLQKEALEFKKHSTKVK
jgi:hypothetical protein